MTIDRTATTVSETCGPAIYAEPPPSWWRRHVCLDMMVAAGCSHYEYDLARRRDQRAQRRVRS